MNQNNSLPQEVTIRYIGNLIRHGENDTFELINLIRQDATHDDVVIGHYYEAIVLRTSDAASESAAGVTPYQAVQRALSKSGVTFR
jgi:hypothetical protein